MEKYHEVRKVGIAVYAARAYLPHEVHAKAVAPKGEKRAVPKAEHAHETPDQINGKCQQ